MGVTVEFSKEIITYLKDSITANEVLDKVYYAKIEKELAN